MTKKGARPDPLWLRAIKEPAAKAWLKKHKDEFPTESFLPDRIAFKDKIVLAREKIAAIIADGMPYEDPDQQELAQLVLTCTPRVIARQLRVSRRETYLRIRSLKRAAVRKWRDKREAAVNERARKGPSIHEAPEGVALQTVKFTMGEREQYAYQVSFKAGPAWLDAQGMRFSDDVQEVLNNLDSLGLNFEVLEVYNGKEQV